MKVFMEVDLNNKELPLRMADRARDLARMCGIEPRGVTNAISRAKRTGNRCRYVKVEIEEDEDDDFG